MRLAHHAAARRAAVLALAVAAAAALPAPAPAQTGNIELELNSAEDTADGCRLTYVATNASNTALEQVSYEVFLFDLEGIVKQPLLFDFGRLPEGKTRVVQFVLPQTACGSISRLLVNSVAQCMSAAGEQAICRDGALLSTRVRTIQFN